MGQRCSKKRLDAYTDNPTDREIKTDSVISKPKFLSKFCRKSSAKPKLKPNVKPTQLHPRPRDRDIAIDGKKDTPAHDHANIIAVSTLPVSWAHPYPVYNNNQHDEQRTTRPLGVAQSQSQTQTQRCMLFEMNKKYPAEREENNNVAEIWDPLLNSLSGSSIEILIDSESSDCLSERLSDDDCDTGLKQGESALSNSVDFTVDINENVRKYSELQSSSLLCCSAKGAIRNNSLSPSTAASSPAHRGVEKQENRLTFKDGHTVKVNANKVEMKVRPPNRGKVASDDKPCVVPPLAEPKESSTPLESESASLPPSTERAQTVRTEVVREVKEDLKLPAKEEECPTMCLTTEPRPGSGVKGDTPKRTGRKRNAKAFTSPKHNSNENKPVNRSPADGSSVKDGSGLPNIGLNYPIVHDYIDKGEKGKKGKREPSPKKQKGNKKKDGSIKKLSQKRNKRRAADRKRRENVDDRLDADCGDETGSLQVVNSESDELVGGATIKDHFRGHTVLFKSLHGKRKR